MQTELTFTAASKSDLPTLSSSEPYGIVIPDWVVEIEEHAFAHCFGLTSVVLPRELNSIALGAFYGCSNLTTVEYATEAVSSTGGSHRDPQSKHTTTAHGWFSSLASNVMHLLGVHHKVNPDVAVIGSNAFGDCRRLTSVVIPPGIVCIGAFAFHKCPLLAEVEIPASCRMIGANAFTGCGLTSLQLCLSSRGCLIHQRAFAHCKYLVVATILGRAYYPFPHEVFAGCQSLQYVVAPSLLKEIEGDLPQGRLVDDTPATNLHALRLQFWSRPTHRLCAPARKQWVLLVMLCAMRLSRYGLHMPSEMWVAIVGFIRRSNLVPIE